MGEPMRRRLLLAISCAALLSVSCGAPQEKQQQAPASGADGPAVEPVRKPDQPVKLTVADVAGNLQLTQKAIEKFRDDHRDLVSSVDFTRSTAPELPGKID